MNARRAILCGVIIGLLLIGALTVLQQKQRDASASANSFAATARQNAAMTEGAGMATFYAQRTLTATRP